MFRELDHHLSEPGTAHRVLEAARQAREGLGEADPAAPRQWLNQQQVSKHKNISQGNTPLCARSEPQS